MALDDNTVFSIKGEVELDTGRVEAELNQLERAAREAAAALALVDELGVSLKDKKAALKEAKSAASLHRKNAQSAADRLSTADRQLDEAERQYRAAEQELDKAKSARRAAEKELNLKNNDVKWAKKHAEKTAAVEAKAQKEYLSRQKKADEALGKLEKAKEAGAKARITKWTKEHKAAAKQANSFKTAAVKASADATAARTAETKAIKAQTTALDRLKSAESAVTQPQRAYQTAVGRRDKAILKQQSALAEAAPLAATHRKSSKQVQSLTKEVGELSDQLSTAKKVEKERKSTRNRVQKEFDAVDALAEKAAKPRKQTKKEAKAAVIAVEEVAAKTKTTKPAAKVVDPAPLPPALLKEVAQAERNRLRNQEVPKDWFRNMLQESATQIVLNKDKKRWEELDRQEKIGKQLHDSKIEYDLARSLDETKLGYTDPKLLEGKVFQKQKDLDTTRLNQLVLDTDNTRRIAKKNEEFNKSLSLQDSLLEKGRRAEVAKTIRGDTSWRDKAVDKFGEKLVSIAEGIDSEGPTKKAAKRPKQGKGRQTSVSSLEDAASKQAEKLNKEQIKLRTEELRRARKQGITVDELREQERPKTRAEKIQALRTNIAKRELDGKDVITESPLFRARERIKGQLKEEPRASTGGLAAALERQDRTAEYVVKQRDERIKREAAAEKTLLAEAKKTEASAKKRAKKEADRLKKSSDDFDKAFKDGSLFDNFFGEKDSEPTTLKDSLRDVRASDKLSTLNKGELDEWTKRGAILGAEEPDKSLKAKKKTLEANALAAQRRIVSDLEKKADKAAADGRIEDATRLRNMAARSKLEFEATRAAEKSNRELIKIRTKELTDARKEGITVAQLREKRRLQEPPKSLQDHLRGFRERFRERSQGARDRFNETGTGRAVNWLTDNRFRRRPTDDADTAPRRRSSGGGPPTPPRPPGGGGRGGRGPLGNLAKGLGVLGLFSGMQAAGEALRAVLSSIWHGFTAGATRAIQLSVQFNDEMRKLNSMTKLNEQDFGKLSDRLRTLSTDMQLPVDPSKAAEAMRGLYAAGYEDVAEAEAVLRQSIKLGIAGFVDQAMAAELLGSVMIAYGASASEAARYSDALIASTDLGLVTMEELHQSMGRVTAAAVQVKMPFEELTGLIGAASATGLRAESAIAGLQQTIKKLLTPTKNQLAAWENYGIEITEASLQADTFLDTLKKIDEAVGGSQKGWQQVVGGNSQSMQFIRALQGDKGPDRWTRTENAIATTHASDENGGLTANRNKEIMKSAQKQFDLFVKYVTQTAMILVDAFEPFAASFLSMLNTDVKPALDGVFTQIAVMVNALAKTFKLGNADSLTGALEAIRKGIEGVTVFLLYMAPVIAATNAVFSTLWNLASILVKSLMGIGDVLVKLGSFDLSGARKAAQGWFKSIADDGKDILQSWNNNLMISWATALDEMEGDFSNFSDKVKAKATGAIISAREARVEELKKSYNLEETGPSIKDHPNKVHRSREQLEYDSAMGQYVYERSHQGRDGHMIRPLEGLYRKKYGPRPGYAKEHFKDDPEGFAKYSKDLENFIREKDSANSGAWKVTTLNPALRRERLEAEFEKLRGVDKPKASTAVPTGPGIKQLGSDFLNWGKSTLKDLWDKASAANEDLGFGPGGRIDTKDRIKQIEQGMSLGEITDKEALKMYTNLLDLEKRSQSREGKEDPEIIYQLRKKQYDLTKSVAREEESIQKQAADHARQMEKVYQGMHLDNLRAAGKEFEAKRKQLQYERDEKLKLEGVDKAQVETWYNSEYQVINKEEQKDREKKAKDKKDEADKKRDERNEKESTRLRLEAEIAGLGPDANFLQQRLLEHEAEFAKFKDVEENKTLIAELEARKRAEIQRKYLLEMQSLRESIENKTKANEVETLKMKGDTNKATKLEEEQAAAERFQQIRDQVEQFREAQASESDIRKYVLSEQTKMLQEAKNKEKQIEEQANRSISGTAADPRMDAKTAFEGMQAGMGFSLSTPGIGGKRSSKGNKDKSNALKKAAARVGQLADPKNALATPQPSQPSDPAASNAKQSLNNFKSGLQQAVGQGKLSQDNRNSLEITIVAPDGSRTKTAATPSKPADANVNLGRFA